VQVILCRTELTGAATLGFYDFGLT
jgi:hypothetical protein